MEEQIFITLWAYTLGMVEVNLCADDGTTYVALMYGDATDYTAEITGMSTHPENVKPGAPPDECCVAVTNLERARSLPDTTGLSLI